MTRSVDQLLMMGLPESGKTTYIVALWHVVESGEVPGSLVLREFLEGDRHYIEKAREKWSKYQTVRRNKTDLKDPIRLTLLDNESSTSVQLSVPDLSGETFKVQFEERGWTQSFSSRIDSATGLLLFVNPDNVKQPYKIADVDAAAGDPDNDDDCDDSDDEDDEDDDDEDDDDEDDDDIDDDAESVADTGDRVDTGVTGTAVLQPKTGGGTKVFTLTECCTAVKIVDLLQFVASALRKPLPLAVVVSAYDVLSDTKYASDPELYLRERLALVDQYLNANPEKFRFRVFGISAQGAAYDSQEDVAAMQKMRCASERIQVITTGDTVHHDASIPIRWLASMSREGT